jgi:site-specific DNA recombinase|tara:strand:+ start:34 stop:702 length:669 start_codon:yes stop_codon:yes gene_type:complete
MKVLGYIRVSSKSQLDGYSIINQKDKINSYCKYMGYNLVEVYEDRGISGMSIDKRDGYRDMLEYLLNNEIDGIIVYSLSRLGRRMKDVIGFLDVLKRSGKSFYSIKENLNNEDKIGSLIVNIMSSINEFEVENIRERIRDVKREKKSKGLVSGRLMYGYDDVDGRLVKNIKETKIISRVKGLRSRGYSWGKISNRLNDEGVKSKYGGVWYMSSLYNMMKLYI